MTAQLEPSIVRIRGTDGNPLGAGFLVAGTQVLVLTCAHVVARALGLADDTCDTPQAEVYVRSI